MRGMVYHSKTFWLSPQVKTENCTCHCSDKHVLFELLVISSENIQMKIYCMRYNCKNAAPLKQMEAGILGKPASLEGKGNPLFP